MTKKNKKDVDKIKLASYELFSDFYEENQLYKKGKLNCSAFSESGNTITLFQNFDCWFIFFVK